MKICIPPFKKSGTWKHFAKINGAPVLNQTVVGWGIVGPDIVTDCTGLVTAATDVVKC